MTAAEKGVAKDPPRSSRARPRLGPTGEAWIAGLLAALVAALVIIPGLDLHGLWSESELAVLDRTRAALGEPLAELERSPYLPDDLRTRSYVLAGGDVGLRLPGAIACCLLVGIAAGLGRARGGSRKMALFAGLFALAFPGLLMSGRSVMGNPIAEVTGVLAVCFGLGALGRAHVAARVLAALAGLACLGLSVLSAGIVIGGVIPVVALALLPGAQGWRRWLAVALWVGALSAGGVAVYLSLRQGEGFIPLLGASKDLVLMSNPHQRGLADGLQELGFLLFPWLPLAIVGALSPGRDRWPGVWLIAGVAITSAWSTIYGSVAIPLTVPAALCCAAGLMHLFDPEQTRVSRRLSLLIVAGGLLIMGKDAKRDPHLVGSPLHYFPAGLDYPDDRIGSEDIFRGVTKVSLLMLFAAYGLSPRSRREGPGEQGRGRLERLGDRIPLGVRYGAPLSIAGALVAAQSIHYARIVIPRTSEQLSAKGVLVRHASWVEQGLVPATFAAHRLRDPGLDAYGPGGEYIVELNSRSELQKWLAVEEPAVALIRRSELAPLHSKRRQQAVPLFVLDQRHHDLVFVANFLPEGLEDQNPIPSVLYDSPPKLANETLVTFDRYVDVIGWEVDTPVVRGGTSTLRIAFRPLRRLPAGTQLYARLQKGKMSRVNATPHELVGGIYPPNNWSSGDYILHEFEFEVPSLEILSGTHEFIIGMRRSEKKNLPIVVPEEETGEFGVRVKGKKREFAILGEVDVL